MLIGCVVLRIIKIPTYLKKRGEGGGIFGSYKI